jgi:NAD(P)-dependent dehydrogenase (short-subunit alcohol dehydrogenase family)
MSYLEELFSLKGKVALVTGGGRGIGQVVAIGLAKAGAAVAIISRSGADETVALIGKAGGKAISLKADVIKEEEVDAALAEIV